MARKLLMNLTKIIINPILLSNLVMGFILVIYSLKWSLDYTEFNHITATLLFTIFLINVLFGKIIAPDLKNTLKCKQKLSKRGVIVVFLLFIVDSVYSGKIPLLSAVLNDSTHYKEINHIPTLYIFYIGLSVYFFLYYYRGYLSLKKNTHLYSAILILFLMILGMGRSHLFICLAAATFLFTLQFLKINNKLPLKQIAYLSLFFTSIFILLSFIRPVTVERFKRSTPEEIFMFIGNANQKVQKSEVLPKIFPLYLYIASPLGNLDNLISLRKTPDQNILNFMVYNYTPESFQKLTLGKNIKEDAFFINKSFNVGTAYWDPYIEFGFWGVIVYHFGIMTLLTLLIILARNSWEQDIILSLSFTVLTFSFFANILVFDSVFIPLALLAFRTLLPKKNER